MVPEPKQRVNSPVLVLLTLALLVAPAVAPAPVGADDAVASSQLLIGELDLPPSIVVEADELEVGAVIVTGLKAGAGACLVGEVEVIIEAEPEGNWVAPRFDED